MPDCGQQVEFTLPVVVGVLDANLVKDVVLAVFAQVFAQDVSEGKVEYVDGRAGVLVDARNPVVCDA